MFWTHPAQSHALEPGYLELAPISDSEWRVTWRKPQVSGQPMAIDAELPAGCAPRRAPPPRFDGRAFVSGWVATCDPQIWEGEVFIDGLSSTATDVLVYYTAQDGGFARTFRLTPDTPAVALPAVMSGWAVSGSYLTLGIDHILGGIDHLLFVFALLILIRDIRRLVGAITAFTVAHSITLAAAALGWVVLPVPPVEALIALSVVFLALEIVQDEGRPRSLVQRAPWVVSFAFGLLHGLGFASALREIGLPPSDIPLALLSFNVGVEAGQLLFLACVLLIAAGLRVAAPSLLERQLQPRAPGKRGAAYLIGGTAAFWTVERVVQFVA
ncbi:MAG: HupE/UreJ family protein [Pseudomonadota bacterium]